MSTAAPLPSLTLQRSLLFLLLAAVTINYIDRGSLSVAAPLMTKEFGWSETQRGWLFSAFFWSYSLCQIGAGWMADRFNPKWVYAGGFVLWSIATAMTGTLSGLSSLVAFRLLLGVGESVTYPAGACILARCFPDHQRGFANGLVDAGSKIGPAISMLAGGLLVDSLGWRYLFLTLGLSSLLWLLPWIILVPGDQLQRESRAQISPGLIAIVRRPEAWGTSLGMFALGYVWILLISWLPTYLVEHRGLSTRDMAMAGSLPFWGMACTSILGGWISDRWIARGHSTTFVRKSFVVAGLALSALFLIPVDLVPDSRLSLALLVLSATALGVFTSNVWAMTQTLAGPPAAGQWAGLQNCIGNLGGVVSPVVTGIVVQKTGSFFMAFVLAAVVLLLGIASYLLLIREVAPLDWNSAKTTRDSLRP